MPDPIKDLYKTVETSGLFMDESDFRDQLTKHPKDVYSLFSSSQMFKDFTDFQEVIGGPPTILGLLRKRKGLAKLKESESTPDAAPGYVPKMPNPQIDTDLGSIDEQIKQKGLDPQVVYKNWEGVDIDNLDIDDNEFSKINSEFGIKPQNAKRSIAAKTWHSSVRGVIKGIEDPNQKSAAEQQLQQLISTGARLPSNNYNTALQYTKNAYGQIISLTAGDAEARKKAIENFKIDVIPVLANVLARDKKATSNMYDIPLQFGHELEKIFDKSRGDQTEALLTTTFQNSKPALQQKERRLAETELLGLNALTSGLDQEYENKLESINEYKAWAEQNGPRIDALRGKIDKSAVTKADMDRYGKLLSVTNEKIKPIRDWDAQNMQRLTDLEKKKGIAELERDEYQGMIDQRNILLEEVNQSMESEIKEMNDIARRAGLSEADIKEYNNLVLEQQRFEDLSKSMQNMQGWTNYIKDKTVTQKDRYPAIKSDMILQAAQEWGGSDVGLAGKTVANFARIGENIGDLIGIAYSGMFDDEATALKKDFERLGLAASDKNMF